MIFYLGQFLQQYWGPARLLTSYAVLITLALYLGFILAYKLIPKFYNVLPQDRGREFTLKENAEAAKGKPTGAGIHFDFRNSKLFDLSHELEPGFHCNHYLAYNAHRLSG